LDTANVDCSTLEKAYSPKTKAVMLAHTLGNPFDIDRVKAFCGEHGLWLIEDNCDALGSKYKGRYTGTFGDVGTSSFYPPHHMTMGEGGAVYTNDSLLAKIMRSMRDWGRDCWCESGKDNTCAHRFDKQYGTLPRGYDHKYVYSHFGYNLKATEMQAAIGVAQLEKLPAFIKNREENYDYLYRAFKDNEKFTIQKAFPASEPSWFGFMLTVNQDSECSRNELAEFLESNNIQTRNLFAGNIIRHPCFEELKEDCDFRIVGELSNTDYIMNNSLWIGVYPGMDREKLDRMIRKINGITEKRM
jgi:CDP-6-deoxy-D-xylo-4-hexulose-3-dehydrase